MVLCILSKYTTFQNSHFSEQPTYLDWEKQVLNIAGSSIPLEKKQDSVKEMWVESKKEGSE